MLGGGGDSFDEFCAGKLGNAGRRKRRRRVAAAADYTADKHQFGQRGNFSSSRIECAVARSRGCLWDAGSSSTQAILCPL